MEVQPVARPMKAAYKMQLEPKTQRKTARNSLVAKNTAPAISKADIKKEVKAEVEAKPKLSKELKERVAKLQSRDPSSDGHYALNSLMSNALESELQKIMIEVWKGLPDSPHSEAEKMVAEKFRTEVGDDLKNALGLNVTKRILNVTNPLYVKIEFDRKPFGLSIQNFIRWLNCAALKRVLDGQHNYVALLIKQSDFDRVISKRFMRMGGLTGIITPYYKFTKCPAKLKTIYKLSTKKDTKEKPDSNEQKPKPENATDENTDTGKKCDDKTSQSVTASVKKPEPVPKAAQIINTEMKKSEAETPNKVEQPIKTKTVPVKTPSAQNVVKTSPGKVETPKKEVKKATPNNKESKVAVKVATKPVNKNKKATPLKIDKNRKRKESDFDELNDEDILALMSNAIVLDECSGSEEE